MDMTSLLKFTIDNHASDLHLSAGNPPIVRIHGELQRIKSTPLGADEIRGLLFSVMKEEHRTVYERDLEIDFAISFGEKARMRVNAFHNREGSAAVFRVIASKIPTLEEVHAPPSLRRLAMLERGLVVVTGPTGSGKSTTLAAMIDYINSTKNCHILTIEDPVEFCHTSKMSLINHREVGADTKSFSRALKSALREDPDVILVGELRDHETIALALTAAETGHLVLGTLHSSSAAKTIDRVIDVFPPSDKEMVRTMLSGSLQGIVSQALLKKVGGGRVVAHEIMVGTNAVRNLVRENQLTQLYSVIQTGSRFGMQTMADSINDLRMAGLVSQETCDEYFRDGTDVTDEVPAKQKVKEPELKAQKPQSSKDVPTDKDGYTF